MPNHAGPCTSKWQPCIMAMATGKTEIRNKSLHDECSQTSCGTGLTSKHKKGIRYDRSIDNLSWSESKKSSRGFRFASLKEDASGAQTGRVWYCSYCDVFTI